MAQGAGAPVATPNGVDRPLTAEEVRLIGEYEKIVQFRDAVLAGTHPRVKIPPHLLAKQANATRNFSTPTVSTPRVNSVAQRSTPNSHSEDASSSQFRSPNNARPGAPVSKSGVSEINPLLLEKSDELVKAEMNLHRQRVERALRDQIEKQRIATKAALQTSESLPNFDISEVLSKALAIVHPSTAVEVQPAAVEDTAASDSFDENTFYSSQHDPSEWSNSSQGQREPVEVQSGSLVSVGGGVGEPISTQSHIEDRQKVVASASLSTNNPPSAQKQHSQHLTDAANLHKQHPALNNSHAATRVATSRNSTDSPPHQPEIGTNNTLMGSRSMVPKPNADQAIVQSTTDDPLRQAFVEDRASPLIRAHNLSPIAPQPARVSPLATAREPPVLRENVLANEAAPAQVAALRNQPAGTSSTDSSPKGVKAAEKKKGGNKKKKRKAKDNGDTPDSPYIKPEPRSPSPFPVAPLPRPQKRQRQSGYAAELNYDEPRYDAEETTAARAPEPYTEVRETRPYQRVEESYEPGFRRPAPPLRRVEDGYRRTVSDAYTRRPQSPAVYATPSYAQGEARPVRAASHAIVDRRIEEPKYYREPLPRTIVRPDADRERSRSPIMHERRSPVAMGPPRQAVRIVRDEFGNEYYDPAPVTPIRQSVAPPVRYREEVVYERPPVRTISGRGEVYEEDGVMYRRPSPPTAISRRVVTQPEYAMAPPSGYRSYREREYSVRPSGLGTSGEEYVPRRQVYEEAIREYAPRAQSIRPEAVRYDIRDEAPHEYHAKPVVREEAAHEYARAASVRPDAVRYEVREDAPREYAPTRVQALREEVSRDYAPRPGSVRPDQVRYEDRDDREYIPKAPVVREDRPREYTRAGSIRPEAIRYEIPGEYGGRVQSVRPEAPPREYASSVRPEGRREMVPQPQREFSVRPVDSLNRREQVPLSKGERYYEEVPAQRSAPVAFIERPRAREASVVVYADDVRSQVYR